ncbi:MAG: hypothetical protein LIO77_02365 [Rikenellaceae bacterium]|nr:hypothetical protein [Rikenellaceae bacterium]
MTGIRRKISTGFLCLGTMLMFSGLVSFFELDRLGSSTRKLLEVSSQNMELSKRMLDAVQEQNTSLLQAIVLEHSAFDNDYTDALQEFESALAESLRIGGDRFELENIYRAKENYSHLVSNYFDDTQNTDIEWFVEMYKTAYTELTAAIKNYMVLSQSSLLSNAAYLRSNAYRAMMPGIITLCVAILMALIFYYLLDLYYTRPLIGIDKGLKGYIASKTPFRVKTEGRDEIDSIRENIETLISNCRK